MIDTLLIANRGEIARRIARTCRALGIRAVAVYSDADADLPFVREADVAYRIGPAPAGASYLQVDAILEAAERAGADAVHPAYGFLSENPELARAVIEADRIWVGPSPDVIRTMGDKSAARRLAAEHGVPTVLGYDGDDQADATFAREAERIGFPVLVKAAAGGGGRGMRRVERAADLPDALASARREAEAAFGSPKLLLERYVERPRHIEVQVLGDSFGEVVHLFERECSVQRRHQKILEEAPSPAVDVALRKQLGEAAVRVARAVGYTGAGTVEFLVDPSGAFSFLEMNTRLQVEHPVTELVTGLDLVALQLRVADGEPLPFSQDDVPLSGHAIEARVYAEDPMRDHMPSAGRLVRFDLPTSEGVRVDAGYASGDMVGVHYDPMLAKVIAWGPDRATANRRLRRALERAWAPGVASNLPLLRQIVSDPSWCEGDLDTGFLARRGLPRPPPLHLAQGAVAATALGWWLRGGARAAVPSGWRIEGPATSTDTWHAGAASVQVWWRRAGRGLEIGAGDDPHDVVVHGYERGVLDLEVDGERRRVRVAVARPGADTVEDGDVVYLHFGDGEAVVSLEPRFPAPAGLTDAPGTLTAPTPGTVVAVKVAVGDRVVKGQALVVIEAMKMEHTVTAPDDGEVTEVRVAEGDGVDQGAVLARVGE